MSKETGARHVINPDNFLFTLIIYYLYCLSIIITREPQNHPIRSVDVRGFYLITLFFHFVFRGFR
jgi:hypothetical protein